MGCDVFISYKRDDQSRVERIAQKLKTIGLEVWFDTRLASGPSFDEQIASQLKTAKIVLVCWSPGAIGSDWVRAEAAMAHGARKLVAVFLEPTDLIPPFNLVHAENLADWNGEDDHAAWAKILVRIAALSQDQELVAWSKIMSDGDSKAMRDWIAAQPPGPLRSTTRYWLSDMGGAPVVLTQPFPTSSRAAQPQGKSGGGSGRAMGVGVLVLLLALVVGGYYAWRTFGAARPEGNTAAAPPTSASVQAASTPAPRTSAGNRVVDGAGRSPSPADAAPAPPVSVPQKTTSAVIEAPVVQQIEITDGTRMRIKPNQLIDFETAQLSDDDGPAFDFEAYVFGGRLRWKSRGSARMSSPIDSMPNKRVCAEATGGATSTDVLMRSPKNYPFLCFITTDGHQGFVSALNDPHEGLVADFAVTFFR